MKKIMAAAVAGLSLVLLLSGCGKKSEDTVQEVTGTNVSVYEAGYAGIESSVTYTGEIKASDEVGVSAKVSGSAARINADIGKYVNAGDVLLEIDSTDYKLQYNQAIAAYNSAKAVYESTIGGTMQQNVNNLSDAIISAQTEYDNALSSYNREKELYDNDTNLISARNALQNAKDNYDRTKKLYDMGAASLTSLDSARIAYENAQATVETTESSLKASMEQAKSRLDMAKVNLDSAKENYDLTVNVLNKENAASAKAQVDSAKAALDIAQNTLNYTTIKAPISGYVSARNISKGEMVSQGATLFVISEISNMTAEVNVTESVIAQIGTGTQAYVSVKSAGIDKITADVSVANAVKDEKTGLYNVKVNIPNTNSVLKAGMFADISLITGRENDAIIIPSDALMQEGDEFYVYIADEKNGTAQKRSVSLGLQDANNTQVTDGVEAGELVIISGKEYLSEKNNLINITSREGVTENEAA